MRMPAGWAAPEAGEDREGDVRRALGQLDHHVCKCASSRIGEDGVLPEPNTPSPASSQGGRELNPC
jgi:hypothetical protein